MIQTNYRVKELERALLKVGVACRALLLSHQEISCPITHVVPLIQDIQGHWLRSITETEDAAGIVRVSADVLSSSPSYPFPIVVLKIQEVTE